MEQPVRRTVRTVARLMPHRASTETAPLSARPQMATSMRPRTATPTRTPGAVGRTPMEAPRNPAHQAGEVRTRAAGHRPLAGAAAEGGETSRRVLEVGQAAVEAEAGAATPVVVATAGELDSDP